MRAAVITQIQPSAGYTPVFFAFVIMATGMALIFAVALVCVPVLPGSKYGSPVGTAMGSVPD